nr:hypothetical protein [Tanacetum cinerariifolium]
MSMLNVEPTVGSFDKQALETELTQLKDAITSVRIQNDGFKVENVNLKRRYQELSTSNSHLRDTLIRKITALTDENAKLKSETLSKMHSKPIVPKKPKVLAPGILKRATTYVFRQIDRSCLEILIVCKFTDIWTREQQAYRNLNTNDDVAFGGKKHEFEGEKPESEVYVSPSSSAQTKTHDDKTKKEAKDNSHIKLSIGYRNLSAEFEDFFDNNINEDNATDSQVPAVGQILTNNTNTFSAAELEDITYSDNKEDVGAEADFTNLETTITASPIPTTRFHKDHHVTQIIGDLSSATQTRSVTRVVKDQGGLTQINNEDFHTCMFACFLSQEEPMRVPNGFLGTKRMKESLYSGIKLDLLHKDTLKRSIDYEEVLSPVARIEAIRFEDPGYPDNVYKVVKDKNVDEILRKFGLIDGKSASTPIDTEKPLLKDPDGEDVDVVGKSATMTQSQWKPTGSTDRPLVFGFWMLKAYDR